MEHTQTGEPNLYLYIGENLQSKTKTNRNYKVWIVYNDQKELHHIQQGEMEVHAKLRWSHTVGHE